MQKKFLDYSIATLHQVDTLTTLDNAFLEHLKPHAQLYQDFQAYRNESSQLTPIQQSEVIIAAGKLLDQFLIKFFDIEEAATKLELKTLSHRPIFVFKKWYVLRRAKRRLQREESLPSFTELNLWLNEQLGPCQDKELQIAEFAVPFLEDEEANSEIIEKITQWCIQALKTKEGQEATLGWVCFKLPNRTDYQRLIPIQIDQTDHLKRSTFPNDKLRYRDGFKLTDPRMSRRQVMSEIDYCIYCHDHDGDFCSKGFPEKKGDPSQGFRTNPLNNILIGCPLDEKISEMHTLKRDGYSLGALATVMIDNPMCPATGHRICNDCMKACIYQKQDPVNIPEIETRVLTDVINLPWGVEIYDFLTYWNPLRKQQQQAKSYNGLKVFIAGMGPAGFTLAHYLLMEGFAVVGTDGLKIEQLDPLLINKPIKNYEDIKEELDKRIMLGFGGVAEYGITVRWDKNFLKLIYISLLRKPHFQVFGGIRFGGTVTVESLWELGFDHAVIAVGAGLPKALAIPGSMAKGMRQANDFLMALQLTGAAKDNSLANLQIRLPAIVIGGGLTGVDTATELQAYYIAQVEKILIHYEILSQEFSESAIRNNFDKENLIILDEFLMHAKAIREERARAKQTNENPHLIKLLKSWGGVTIVYRRAIQDSPAYLSNHEELNKAFEEGIYYLEGLQPIAAQLDEYGHINKVCCEKRLQDAEGNWLDDHHTVELPAKSVLVATGAQPNIAYTFEHEGTFVRNRLEYQPYENIDENLVIVKAAENIKEPLFGPFTSYQVDNKRVSFIGDTHPVFQGNVVKAISSALRSYPKIVELFGELTKQTTDETEYELFAKFISESFASKITAVTRRSKNVIELTVHAPLAVKKFKPGQFFRVQNYETSAIEVEKTKLQTEPLALAGFYPSFEQGTIKLMIIEQGASTKMCATFKPGDSIALMGPTGVRSKIPHDQQTILIIGNTQQSLAYVRAVGPALKAANNRVIYLGCFASAEELFCQTEIEQCTDQTIWSTLDNSTITPSRKNDYSFNDEAINTLLNISLDKNLIDLTNIDRITVLGDSYLLKNFQLARSTLLQHKLKPNVKVFGAIYSSMQCMLKGVCAQCLQWQINPETGQRTKAVFACSWQDQPLELVDLDNLAERLGQNKVCETLSSLWFDYLKVKASPDLTII
ncbi:MAG: pyridine nucleotide-disulfide oxidoreductase [Gammaproteobacteria bacterium RIFCSPHIGHO2_12_FULL_35_23]|nr:MAG: pyridine nucleotide-disulfide oxidoreductase [Gammaproteobacteria bacterium RIFCSPHIGHO2_12_FULL_35_23]